MRSTTWIDGWKTADNGAVVGYSDPDWAAGEHFIETFIAHSGEQSMPFFYDNDKKYSEARLPLTGSLSDWTQEASIHWCCGIGGTPHAWAPSRACRATSTR
jgi:hypothetical protein